jgi:hypothetical protein
VYLEFCGHEWRVIVPVNEGKVVAYVGWLAIERAAGRRSVSLGIIATVTFSRACCGKLIFRQS